MVDRGYANPDMLWSVEELKSAAGSVCIVDTRPVHEFVAGHIPGALHLDVFGLSLNDTSPEPFAAFMWTYSYLFHSRGVGSEQTVVFYDNISGTPSARGFWICEYHGQKGVHVLDGGFDAWREAELEVSQACDAVEPVEFKSDPLPDLHIGYQEIVDLLNRDEFTLLDTRSEGEYFGTTVRAARGGSIPGAVHIEYANNLDEKGRFKHGDALRTMYVRAGVMPEQTIACY